MDVAADSWKLLIEACSMGVLFASRVSRSVAEGAWLSQHHSTFVTDAQCLIYRSKLHHEGKVRYPAKSFGASVYPALLEVDGYLDNCFRRFYDVSNLNLVIAKQQAVAQVCLARDDIWNYFASTTPSNVDMPRTCALWKLFVKRFISAGEVTGVPSSAFRAVALAILKVDASLPERVLQNNVWDAHINKLVMLPRESMKLWKCGGHPNVARSRDVYSVHADLASISHEMKVLPRASICFSHLCKESHGVLVSSPELSSLLLKAISTVRWMNSHSSAEAKSHGSPKYLLDVVQSKRAECTDAVFGTSLNDFGATALQRWCSVQLWPLKDHWSTLLESRACGKLLMLSSSIEAGMLNSQSKADAAKWLERAVTFASESTSRNMDGLAAAQHAVWMLESESSTMPNQLKSELSAVLLSWHKGCWLGRFNRLTSIDTGLLAENTYAEGSEKESRSALSGPIRMSQDVCSLHTARLLLGTRLGIEKEEGNFVRTRGCKVSAPLAIREQAAKA